MTTASTPTSAVFALGTTEGTDPDPGPFGAALKALRAKYDASQTFVAEGAGLDHSLISRLENGKRNPTRENVDAICASLRLTAPDASHLYAAAGLIPPGWDDAVVALISGGSTTKGARRLMREQQERIRELEQRVRYYERMMARIKGRADGLALLLEDVA